MSNQPRRRPWFQLHLGTCTLLMIGAGVLVWLNIREDKTMELPGQMVIYRDYRGFPFSFYKHKELHFINDAPVETELKPEISDEIEVMALLGNLAANLAILVLSALACEFLMRRKEGKAPGRIASSRSNPPDP